MATETSPFDLALRLGQSRSREPAHREGQRQRVANLELDRLAILEVAQRTRAVGNCRVEGSAVVVMQVVLWQRVQQDVEMRANMHVAKLELARERKYERDVLLGRRLLVDNGRMASRARGDAARERRIAVNVELEEMVEGVGDEGDGAVDFALDAVVEAQRLACLLAHGEVDPLHLVVILFDVLAGFSVADRQRVN